MAFNKVFFEIMTNFLDFKKVAYNKKKYIKNTRKYKCMEYLLLE